jgi:hypothetical protein
MSNIAKLTDPQRPKMIVPRLSLRRRNGTRTTLVMAAVLIATAVSLLLVMPILVAKQTSVVRADASQSTDVFELMKRAKDLPVQEIDGLI